MDKEVMARTIGNVLDVTNQSYYKKFMGDDLFNSLKENIELKININNDNDLSDIINDLLNNNIDLINRIISNDDSLTAQELNGFYEKIKKLKRIYILKK